MRCWPGRPRRRVDSRVAAHYRDNLAILNRSRESPSSPLTPAELPKMPVEPSKTPAQPKSLPKAGGAPGGETNGPPRFLPIKALLPDLTSQNTPPIKPKPEPTPPSEPFETQPEKSSLSEPSSSNMTAGLGSTEPSKNESSLELNASSDTKLPDRAASSSNESQPGREATVGSKPVSTNVSLEQADRLFADKRYDEAGGFYAALARQNRLPTNRKEHWAYCRWVEVVRRINAGPKTVREWEEIDSEVQSIQQLTPKSWYGEYLRSKVAEARRSGPRPTVQSSNLAVARLGAGRQQTLEISASPR